MKGKSNNLHVLKKYKIYFLKGKPSDYLFIDINKIALSSVEFR